MKPKPPIQVRARLTNEQSAEVRRILVEAAKVNALNISENTVAKMAVGIGLPEVRRKLVGKDCK